MAALMASSTGMSTTMTFKGTFAPQKAVTVPMKPTFKVTAAQCFTSNISKTFSTHATLNRAITRRNSNISTAAVATSTIDALIFDCDGVIVESEDIHRRAYNAAFQNFNVQCPGQNGIVDWSVEFYDMLQNKVGGGKPKMRWYFGENGWPTSSVLDGRAPETDEEKILLVDVLQEWKTNKYKDFIGSGEIHPRPGIIELMDAARASGTPVAVCSASTKPAVTFVLENLLGMDRFKSLDLFIAGDDVPFKKPDPTIYKVAAERLKLAPARCLVIEDSLIGMKAALGAGMRCVITYHSGTVSQDFPGATAVLGTMEGVEFADLASGAFNGVDDRK